MNIILLVYMPIQGELTPLHHAAQYNHATVVEALTRSGADVNAVEKVLNILAKHCMV